MVNPIATIFSSVKSKFRTMTAGIKKYLNPRYLARLINVQVKKMMQTLFSVKPKSREDYYALGSLLISKKLAILIVVLINLGCIMIVLNLLPAKAPAGTDVASQKIPSYKYTSLRLAGFNGTAQVLSSGKVVYRGVLEKGIAKGEGTLFDLKGNLVYVGQFDKNMYNGMGTTYYENGDILYTGDFVDNLYNGKGTLYYPDNIKKYEGEFASSVKSGAGTLFGKDGTVTYEGQFLSDRINFLRLLGMPSSELACFKGKNKLYEEEYSTAVEYGDFNLIYEVEPQPDDAEKNTIIRCYDVGGLISGDVPITSAELEKKFGKSVYQGDATLNYTDYVAINILKDEVSKTTEDKIMKTIINEKYKCELDEISEGAYHVNPQSDETIYIETYMSGEYCYTYYFVDKTKPYSFYSVEKVSK